ncbi:unnamed protein product [Miscanthus lutarioriparius]|uniref:Uncharacterized protein n=1 Tax=Miscanthus lutarioriparius TaxID=422564 RepID=A0A811PGB6_9POAL|nr:unnamed protein product [Miscanthus lutarioriparius]
MEELDLGPAMEGLDPGLDHGCARARPWLDQRGAQPTASRALAPPPDRPPPRPSDLDGRRGELDLCHGGWILAMAGGRILARGRQILARPRWRRAELWGEVRRRRADLSQGWILAMMSRPPVAAACHPLHYRHPLHELSAGAFCFSHGRRVYRNIYKPNGQLLVGQRVSLQDLKVSLQ